MNRQLNKETLCDALKVLAGYMGAVLVVAWLLMLALGVLRHDVHRGVPALGYLPVLTLLLAALALLRFTIHTNTSD